MLQDRELCGVLGGRVESDYRVDLDIPADDGNIFDFPPSEDPGPERGPPERSADPEPHTGPWFSLSMLVFVAWSGLTLTGMTLPRSAGALGSWIVAGGFIALYWCFLYFGGRWFEQWRRQ